MHLLIDHFRPVLVSVLLALAVAIPIVGWATKSGPPTQFQLPGDVQENWEPIAFTRAQAERSQVRSAIANGLAEGQLSAAEALEPFQEINARWPEIDVTVLRQHPDDSVEICVCRQVLSHVGVIVRDRSDRVAILQRVEAELQAHLDEVEGPADRAARWLYPSPPRPHHPARPAPAAP